MPSAILRGAERPKPTAISCGTQVLLMTPDQRWHFCAPREAGPAAQQGLGDCPWEGQTPLSQQVEERGRGELRARPLGFLQRWVSDHRHSLEVLWLLPGVAGKPGSGMLLPLPALFCSRFSREGLFPEKLRQRGESSNLSQYKHGYCSEVLCLSKATSFNLPAISPLFLVCVLTTHFLAAVSGHDKRASFLPLLRTEQ